MKTSNVNPFHTLYAGCLWVSQTIYLAQAPHRKKVPVTKQTQDSNCIGNSFLVGGQKLWLLGPLWRRNRLPWVAPTWSKRRFFWLHMFQTYGGGPKIICSTPETTKNIPSLQSERPPTQGQLFPSQVVTVGPFIKLFSRKANWRTNAGRSKRHRPGGHLCDLLVDCFANLRWSGVGRYFWELNYTQKRNPSSTYSRKVVQKQPCKTINDFDIQSKETSLSCMNLSGMMANGSFKSSTSLICPLAPKADPQLQTKFSSSR